MLLNNKWVKIKSRKESKDILRQMKMRTQQPKIHGTQKNSPKREIHNNTALPQETRKISPKQSKLTPKGSKERTTNKVQSEWRKY